MAQGRQLTIIDPTNLSNEKHRQLLLKYLNKHPEQDYLGKAGQHDYEVDGQHFQLKWPLLLRQKTIEGQDVKPLLAYDVLGEVLGAGAFGSVMEVPAVLTVSQSSLTVKPDNKHVIKMMSNKEMVDSEHEKQTQSERHHEKPMRILAHANKVSTYYLTSHRFSGTTLEKILKSNDISDEKRLQLTIALLRALKEQVHDFDWIHRDIKPENIIVDLDTMSVNIIDYGLTVKLNQKNIKFKGSDYYRSREEIMVEENPVNDSIDQATDIFSMGRTLARLWGDNDEYWKWNARAVKNYMMSSDEEYVPCTLFENQRGQAYEAFMYLTPNIRKAIEDQINAMNMFDPNNRHHIEDLVSEFHNIYLMVKYPQHKDHQYLLQIFKQGQEVKKQLTKNTTNEKFLETLTASLKNIKDDKTVIAEFVHGLGWHTLSGAKSKSDILKKADNVIKNHDQLIQRYLDLYAEANDLRLIYKQILDPKTTEELMQFTAFLEQKIQRLKQKPYDLDLLVRSKDDIETNINHWLLRLNNIHETIKLTKSPIKPSINERNMDEKLDVLKERLYDQIRRYMTETIPSIKLFDSKRAASPQRRQDILSLIDIIKRSNSEEMLVTDVHNHLKNIKTGLLGRSQLRHLVLNTINEFQQQKITIKK